jgi:hypothetical protein
LKKRGAKCAAHKRTARRDQRAMHET